MSEQKWSEKQVLSVDNKTFQNHLIRIVGLPIFFIILMLLGYYFQGNYFSDLRQKGRTLEATKIQVLKLDKLFSEIEGALRGVAFSDKQRFNDVLKEKTKLVEPVSDKLFDLVSDDTSRSKKLRSLMKTYDLFFDNIQETLKVSEKKTEEQTEMFLINTRNIYRELKREVGLFYLAIEADQVLVAKKQNEMEKLSSVVELITVVILVIFIVFIMMRQLKSLTSSYRNLLHKNVENMKRIEASSKTKDLFLANMSHEIRTPLGAILGFAELLSKNKSLSPEAKSHSIFIKRNSEHLLGLVDDLFDISRLVADKLEVHEESVNLAQFIVDIENYFQSKLNDRKIKLKVTLDTRIPEQVKSDPVRLKQIITNLVGNAIKFSPNGSEVKLIFSFSAGRLQVDVIDNGIGIDRKIHDKIFDAFIQAEDEHSRNFGGAGLGLSISKKLANAMEGDLTLVSSRLKVGSHFRLSLPAEAQSTSFLERKYRETAQVFDLKETKGVRNEFDFSDKKILLAEDSQENQILFKIFLESAKTNLEIVGNGSDAVRKALADDFDAILMDIQMPGLDGYEAVNILRGSHYQKPIIALTAHAMKGEREKCLEAGFSDYVSKPVSQQTLLSTLDRNLS